MFELSDHKPFPVVSDTLKDFLAHKKASAPLGRPVQEVVAQGMTVPVPPGVKEEHVEEAIALARKLQNMSLRDKGILAQLASQFTREYFKEFGQGATGLLLEVAIDAYVELMCQIGSIHVVGQSEVMTARKLTHQAPAFARMFLAIEQRIGSLMAQLVNDQLGEELVRLDGLLNGERELMSGAAERAQADATAERRRADALQCSRGDQHLDGRGHPAGDGCGREGHDADAEHPSPAEPITQRPAEQHQRGEGDEVGIEHPLQALQVGVEVRRDGRQGHVDDGAVEEGHARTEDRGQQHPASCGRPHAHLRNLGRRSSGASDDDAGVSEAPAVEQHEDDLLALYDRALPAVYGYLVRRCDGRTTAEDLTAETFLAAVASVKKGAVTQVSEAWLVGIARHKLVDHWRRQAREERNLSAVFDDRDEVDDPWDDELDAAVARQVLTTLGAHHRVALTLRYLDGLPVPEVADHLGRTVHATEALLVRARLAFRRAYDPEGSGRGA